MNPLSYLCLRIYWPPIHSWTCFGLVGTPTASAFSPPPPPTTTQDKRGTISSWAPSVQRRNLLSEVGFPLGNTSFLCGCFEDCFFLFHFHMANYVVCFGVIFLLVVVHPFGDSFNFWNLQACAFCQIWEFCSDFFEHFLNLFVFLFLCLSLSLSVTTLMTQVPETLLNFNRTLRSGKTRGKLKPSLTPFVSGNRL